MQIWRSNLTIECDFWEGRSPQYFFHEICSSGGTQTINKVSAVFNIKSAILDAASGKFIAGDPDHQRQT